MNKRTVQGGIVFVASAIISAILQSASTGNTQNITAIGITALGAAVTATATYLMQPPPKGGNNGDASKPESK